MQQRIPYDGNDLGAVYTKKYTAFRLWAPTADAVTLCLYREGDGDCLSDTLPMKRDVQGTWAIRVDGDLRHISVLAQNRFPPLCRSTWASSMWCRWSFLS